MIKVKLNKRAVAARKKDGAEQFLMTGTECYMEENRANYMAALGDVEIIKEAAKKKAPAKKAAADAPATEDTAGDAA